MSSDGTSTPDDPGDEAGRTAAPDEACEACEADEIALARRLGDLAPSLNPDPQARERARRRLLDALSRES